MSKELDTILISSFDSSGIPDEIRHKAVMLHFNKGEVLCRQGFDFPYLYYITEGKVKVCVTEANGKTMLISFYLAGSTLGDVEMMLNCNATTTVTAIAPTTCIGLPMKSCRIALTNNLSYMRSTAEAIAIKLDKSSKRNATNMLYSLENRLCAYIDATNENGHFHENLTEIAELLGTSYRHLLRLMASLCQDNILTKLSRTKYQVADFIKLREKAKDCYYNY